MQRMKPKGVICLGCLIKEKCKKNVQNPLNVVWEESVVVQL